MSGERRSPGGAGIPGWVNPGLFGRGVANVERAPSAWTMRDGNEYSMRSLRTPTITTSPSRRVALWAGWATGEVDDSYCQPRNGPIAEPPSVAYAQLRVNSETTSELIGGSAQTGGRCAPWDLDYSCGIQFRRGGLHIR